MTTAQPAGSDAGLWEEPETYAEALAWIEDRVFSSHWRLPDERWRGAATQVRAEVDLPQPTRHTFTFTAVRF